VAADKSGLTIACTSTINTIFGSILMIPGRYLYELLMPDHVSLTYDDSRDRCNHEQRNEWYVPLIYLPIAMADDHVTDFSIPNTTNAFGYIPTTANFIKPFKRPLSSISPTIVEYPNGTVFISHASAGGSRIITEIVQHLWHVMDQKMTSAQALRQPRFHDQLSPNTVSFEYAGDAYGVAGYSNETTAYFKEIGANVAFVAVGSTTAQAIRVLGNGTFEAAGEPRQRNSAGYAI
jgi:gamma-glutamyltranspeptidase/glutathione hydrolase